MGQQQLLLIILGVIVVGIAVAVGVTMFNDSAVSANRDAVTNDLVNFASRCQQYFRRPKALGGGGGSFVGIADMRQLTKTNVATYTNGNGTYSVPVAGTATTVQLQGLGTETGNDGTAKVKVTMDVWADSARVNQTGTNFN
jgi:hypothetical protein